MEDLCTHITVSKSSVYFLLLQIMRFCYSFMEELYRHIGPNQVPIFVSSYIFLDNYE